MEKSVNPLPGLPACRFSVGEKRWVKSEKVKSLFVFHRFVECCGETGEKL